MSPEYTCNMWRKLLILSSIITAAHGLKCFSCERAPSNVDCNWAGVVDCDEEKEQSCLSQFDYSSGELRVTKFCSSSEFCQTLSEISCSHSGKNGTCFSCCQGDACNFRGANENEEIISDIPSYSDKPYTIPDNCPLPDFTIPTSRVIYSSPNEVVMMVDLSKANMADKGWSVVAVFSRSLPRDYTIEAFGSTCVKTASGRRSLFFKDKEHNSKLEAFARKHFIFAIKSEGGIVITDSYYTANLGFINEKNVSKECVKTYAPLFPSYEITETLIPATTDAIDVTVTESVDNFNTTSTDNATSTTTTIVTVTTVPDKTTTEITTQSPTTTKMQTTKNTPLNTTPISQTTPATSLAPSSEVKTTTPANVIQQSDATCESASYVIVNPGYTGKDKKWRFSFRVVAQVQQRPDWSIKIAFEKEMSKVFIFKMRARMLDLNGKIWGFKPSSRILNAKKENYVAVGVGTLAQSFNKDEVDQRNGIPQGKSYICGKKTKYREINITPTTTTTTTSSATTHEPTTPNAPTTTEAYSFKPNERCQGPPGLLPPSSGQTIANKFKPSPKSDDLKYDYNQLLHLSLLFYEAQRSGNLSSDNRIPWRGHSGLKDGCDVGVDLVGGYYDAGDHVKFGFPMASTITVIAWGMIEFKDAYVEAGEWENGLAMLKWGTDYFIKAHTGPTELWVQVGDGKADHSYWGHAETMNMGRPAYKIDKSNPGSEVAAETAAAMAATSILFRDEDPEYANILVKHASNLFYFANKYRKNYHLSVPGVEVFYKSWSGYEDELAWAAAWMYKASKRPQYLKFAERMAYMLNAGEFSWDQKGPGVFALLAQINPTRYIKNLHDGIKQNMGRRKTPAGLSWFMEWGPNRYSANYAFISLVTAKIIGRGSMAEKYRAFAEEQIHLMLGDGDNKRSYVVGYGVNPPQRPHHRSSSCEPWTDRGNAPCTHNDLNKSTPNKLVLYGALVGGPGAKGQYEDDRKDYKMNEVAMDYNSGFQSAIAGLKYFVMQKRRN